MNSELEKVKEWCDANTLSVGQYGQKYSKNQVYDNFDYHNQMGNKEE